MNLIKNFVHWCQTLYKILNTKRIINKKDYTTPTGEYLYRQQNLATQIQFVLDTIECAKLDIVYMENLKQPLSPDESVYFIQQLDRLNGAATILIWIQQNIRLNESFFKKLVR